MRRGKALSSITIALLSIVLVVLWSRPAGASITAVGDIDPAYNGTDDPWILATNLMIGRTADASLVVSGGSQVLPFSDITDGGVGLAWDAGVTASLTVMGPGSLLRNSGLTLGFLGNANLLVADGATVSGGGAVLAENAGSTALATVTGAGSLWENEIDLQIGRGGDGTVVVANGGTLTSGIAYLGFDANSVGRVTVTGPNSVWENLSPGYGGDIYVGWSGAGSTTVADGGRFTAAWTFLALNQGATGTFTVTGPNSLWDSNQVTVGGLGNAIVNISDGGRAVTDAVFSAGNYGSTAAINVSGPGSLWEAREYLGVAGEGRADMVISNGGRVYSGWSQVAEYEQSVGTVTVTGPNSVWDAGDALILGVHGDANMVVADGGTVTDREAFVAQHAGSTARATVTGTGSTWDNSAELQVGVAGQGRVTVAEGGRLTSRTGILGFGSPGFGVVEVIGSDSAWEILPDPNSGVGGDLYVGQSGHGRLVIGQGARVASAGGYIGNALSGSGDLQVTGAGSAWDNSAELQVGVAGWGNLYVEDEARVTSRTGVLGVESTGLGYVRVDYPGSLWEILPDPNTGLGGDLSVGQAGYGHLQIGSISESGVGGGTVTARSGVIAAEPNSEALVTVIGEGSRLEIDEELIVGLGGYARLGVGEGGQVRTMLATVGAEAGSTGTVSLSQGASWVSTDSLIVGNRGQGELVISDGGHMYNDLATSLGEEAGGVGTVLVSGAGSTLTGTFGYVGRLGQGSMTIADGGLVGNHHGRVGFGPGSLGEVFVTGAGSLWDAELDLMVGLEGEGWLTVSDGGRVTTRHGFLGTELDGVGSVVVTGPNSVLEASRLLYVGGDESGPQGTGYLGIYNAGLVDGNDVTIWPTGTLMGDGTLKANLVHDYGTISPGASIGTLTVDGDLSVNSGSVLEIELDNEGNSDKLLVTGHVGFSGSVEPIPVETIVGTHQYVVVEANSLSVELSGWIDPPFSIPEPVPGLLRTSVRRGLGEDVNSLLLYVTALPFDDPNIVQTDNQRSLGAALQALAGGDVNEVTIALQQLQTADEVRQAYDQLSGQTIPALAPVSVADTTKYMGMISSRLRSSAGAFSNSVGLPLDSAGTGPDAMAGADMLGVDAGRYGFAAGNGTPHLSGEPWGVWGRGYGLFGDRESEGGVPGYDYHIYGATFGLDYQLTQRLLLGFTAGYSDGDIAYSSSRDRADVDSTHAGLYGRYDTPWWYVDAIGTYADLDYETRRFVDPLGEQLEGDPSGSLVSGYVEVGAYRWLSERCLLQPLAAFQISSLHLDSFTESGGVSALHFDDEHYDSYRGSLGVKVTQELFRHDDGCRASAELRGRWVHEFGDTRASLDAAFASSPGVVFRVSDSEIARDSAVLGAGLDTWFGRSLRAFLDYATELNPDNTIQLVSAGLEYRW